MDREKGRGDTSMKRLILAVVTILMAVVVAVEAGVLYRMVSMVARGESPRQQEGKAEEPEEPGEPDGTSEPEEGPGTAEDGEAAEERLTEAGDIGEYHIEIGEAERTKDTSGNAAVIVTYTWTNNSEASTSAMVMLMERAYQGETRLTSAQVEAAGYDSDSGSRTVGPGSTGTVQRAFVLEEEDGALTFEVSEFLSQTNSAVIKEFDLSK